MQTPLNELTANQLIEQYIGTAYDTVKAVQANEANINAAVGAVAAIDTVSTNIANITLVATDIANVNSVAGNEANINAVQANEANINAVQANEANINAVATDITNVNTTATDIANVNSVAGNESNINAVQANESNINVVASNIGDISAVNTIVTNLDAMIRNEVNGVADINTAGGDATTIDYTADSITMAPRIAGGGTTAIVKTGVSVLSEPILAEAGVADGEHWMNGYLVYDDVGDTYDVIFLLDGSDPETELTGTHYSFITIALLNFATGFDAALTKSKTHNRQIFFTEDKALYSGSLAEGISFNVLATEMPQKIQHAVMDLDIFTFSPGTFISINRVQIDSLQTYFKQKVDAPWETGETSLNMRLKNLLLYPNGGYINVHPFGNYDGETALLNFYIQQALMLD